VVRTGRLRELRHANVFRRRTVAFRERRRPLIHPLIVRITHWINAGAIIIMIMSGLEIHNAYPILPFMVPRAITLGGWLGGATQWHFAAMWC